MTHNIPYNVPTAWHGLAWQTAKHSTALCSMSSLAWHYDPSSKCIVNCLCRRERPAPSDCKMATRERNRLRDRSKSSDISCEPSSSALPTGQAPNGLSRLASGPSRAAAASIAPAAAPSTTASPADVDLRCNADLLVKAAAAVHRAEALQRAEASESDVSPRSRQSGHQLASEHGARRRQREGREEKQRPKRERSTVDVDAEATADEQQLPHAEEGLPDQAPGHPASEARRVKRKVRSDDVYDVQVEPFASYLHGILRCRFCAALASFT